MIELVVMGLWSFIAVVALGDAALAVRRAWFGRSSTTEFQLIMIAVISVIITFVWWFK